MGFGDDWTGGARKASVKSITRIEQVKVFPNPTAGRITLIDILPENIKQLGNV